MFRRNFVFSIVQSAVSAAPQLSREAKQTWPAYLQDLPWTMLRFASITRSAHQLRDISLALLMKLQHLPTFSQQAYAQEHLMALVCMHSFVAAAYTFCWRSLWLRIADSMFVAVWRCTSISICLSVCSYFCVCRSLSVSVSLSLGACLSASRLCVCLRMATSLHAAL